MIHLNGARVFGCADIQKALNYMPVIIISDGAYEM